MESSSTNSEAAASNHSISKALLLASSASPEDEEEGASTPTDPAIDHPDAPHCHPPPTFVASFKCSPNDLGTVFGAVGQQGGETPTDGSNQVRLWGGGEKACVKCHLEKGSML